MSRFSCRARGLQNVDHEPGFVLVGVVMFVLALTILGLSLFALSSFEAQFQTRSYLSGQAFNVAQGGVEHVKFVLANMTRLEDVKASLYPSGVVYARARRLDGVDPDTVGRIEDLPNGTPIEIRVLANLNGERHMVESHFTIDQTPQVYKRLMSITDSLYANRLQLHDDIPANAWPACDNTYFNGEVWEGGMAGTGWSTCAHGITSLTSPAQLPTPDVKSFFAKHLYDSKTKDVNIPNPFLEQDFDRWLTGPNGNNKVGYFRTINNDATRGISSLYIPKHKEENEPGTTTIHVSGWVVWMLPRGLRIDGRLEVLGGTDDCLVIVAGTPPDTTDIIDSDLLPPAPPLVVNASLAIRSSLKSDNVPVILVTDGWAVIEHAHWDTWTRGETVNYLSVFARSGLFAAGGADPALGRHMNLNHPVNSSFDQEGDLIDDLCRKGALPNAQSGGTMLTPVAGTWRELDPDKPPN